MRIPQAVAENLAKRIQQEYPHAAGVTVLPLPIGGVFSLAHPIKGGTAVQYVEGLISDDTKGCAVLKRTRDVSEAAHLAAMLAVSLVPFMNASLDVMGVDHTHMDV